MSWRHLGEGSHRAGVSWRHLEEGSHRAGVSWRVEATSWGEVGWRGVRGKGWDAGRAVTSATRTVRPTIREVMLPIQPEKELDREPSLLVDAFNRSAFAAAKVFEVSLSVAGESVGWKWVRVCGEGGGGEDGASASVESRIVSP